MVIWGMSPSPPSGESVITEGRAPHGSLAERGMQIMPKGIRVNGIRKLIQFRHGGF